MKSMTDNKFFRNYLTLFIICFFIAKAESAKAQIDKSLPPLVDRLIKNEEAYMGDEFLFFKMQDIANPKIDSENNILEFVNHNRNFITGICECQLTNDSIIVSGGLGYGGNGIMFAILFSNNINSGNFWLGDESRLLSLTKDSLKGNKELLINLTLDKYAFNKKPKKELQEILYGKFKGEGASFYELINGKWVERKMKIELVFKCKLSEHSPL